MGNLGRRDALKLGVLGGAALLLPFERVVQARRASDKLALSKLPKQFTVPFAVPPVLSPELVGSSTDYFQIDMKPAMTSIIPGRPTPILGYEGTFPGPTIRMRKGRRSVVRFCNELPPTHPTLGHVLQTSTHLHGSASLPQYDGYANDLTQPGSWKDYVFANNQEPRTLWYHDHGVHHTAQNVYSGLAGQYHIVDDEHDALLGIPRGKYDVPLVISDAAFASDGTLIFDDEDRSGLYGDVLLVNGRPWPLMQVERRKYRFRVLNASIARGYSLELSTGEPLIIIGTDGGLMPAPQPVGRLRYGVAERYEIVIDFAKYALGQRVVLRNRGVENSRDYDGTRNVMAFDVVAEAADPTGNDVPSELNPDEPTMSLTPDMAVRTRKFEFKKDDDVWTINGKSWKDVEDSNYQVLLANPGLGDIEIWEFQNPRGGWNHPVHTHLIDFQVLTRNGRPPFAHERGPKDTVYVGEDEVVRVLARFGPHQGRYMIHCHNLPHEDHDMMGQFQVGPPGSGDDPINTVLPQLLPSPPFVLDEPLPDLAPEDPGAVTPPDEPVAPPVDEVVVEPPPEEPVVVVPPVVSPPRPPRRRPRNRRPAPRRRRRDDR